MEEGSEKGFEGWFSSVGSFLKNGIAQICEKRQDAGVSKEEQDIRRTGRTERKNGAELCIRERLAESPRKRTGNKVFHTNKRRRESLSLSLRPTLSWNF